MSCPSWQWHRTQAASEAVGLQFEPYRDLRLPCGVTLDSSRTVTNSSGNKAAANLRPTAKLLGFARAPVEGLYHPFKLSLRGQQNKFLYMFQTFIPLEKAFELHS